MIRHTSSAILGSLLAAACNQAAVGTTNNADAGSKPDLIATAVAPIKADTAIGSVVPRTTANDRVDDAEKGAVGADHAVVIASLKRELVGTSKVDGRPITNVTMETRCRTTFVTAVGDVAVNWAKVGNFAGDVLKGIVTLPITDDVGEHTFTIPEGVGYRRINGSMGLLADDCKS